MKTYFNAQGRCKYKSGDRAEALRMCMSKQTDVDLITGGGMRFNVRRLTPKECERLQGFPDDYTLIPYKGKPAKDGPRYKALGNSMAVNCMSWLGQRIQMVDEIIKEQDEV